jgi:hypothetical protein
MAAPSFPARGVAEGRTGTQPLRLVDCPYGLFLALDRYRDGSNQLNVSQPAMHGSFVQLGANALQEPTGPRVPKQPPPAT